MGFIAGLGARAVGFFGGGIAAKVAIGGFAALGITVLALWWVIGDLAEANQFVGESRRAVAERDTAIRTLSARIGNYETELVNQDTRHTNELELVTNTFTQRLALQDQLFTKKTNINKVIQNDPDATAWANSPVPDGVLACLRSTDAAPCAAGSSSAAKN